MLALMMMLLVRLLYVTTKKRERRNFAHIILEFLRTSLFYGVFFSYEIYLLIEGRDRIIKNIYITFEKVPGLIFLSLPSLALGCLREGKL